MLSAPLAAGGNGNASDPGLGFRALCPPVELPLENLFSSAVKSAGTFLVHAYSPTPTPHPRQGWDSFLASRRAGLGDVLLPRLSA